MKLLTAEIGVLRRQVEEDQDEVEELKDRVGNFKVQMQGREVHSSSCVLFRVTRHLSLPDLAYQILASLPRLFPPPVLPVS